MSAAARPVLLPRPRGRGQELTRQLTAQGVTVEHVPFVGFGPGDDAALRPALSSLAAGDYDDLVVTSRTAVPVLDGTVVPATTRVIAVGRGTAGALEAAGIPVALTASGSGAAVVTAMTASDGPAPAGRRVLLPVSAAAAPTVRDGLVAAGCEVTRVDAYRPLLLDLPPHVALGLPDGAFAAIVLTSPMIARRAAELGVHPTTAVVSIGDPTSQAARSGGLPVAVQAEVADDRHLAAAVLRTLDSPTSKETP